MRRRCWPGASTGSWCLWRWQRGPEGSRGGPTAPARRPGRCWRPCQHRGSGAGGQSCSFLAGGPLTLVTGEQPLTPKSPVSWSPRLLGEWQAPWPSRGSPDRQLSGDEPPQADKHPRDTRRGGASGTQASAGGTGGGAAAPPAPGLVHPRPLPYGRVCFRQAQPSAGAQGWRGGSAHTPAVGRHAAA